MRLVVKTVGGKEALLEVDPDLPLDVVRTQAASLLELDADPVFVLRGRVLPPEEGDRPLREFGLQDGNLLVALIKGAHHSREESEAQAFSEQGENRTEAGRTPGSVDHVLTAVTLPSSLPSSSARHDVVDADAEFALQLQADEDERVARRFQEEVDGEIAMEEQAKHSLGEARVAEIKAVPRLCHVRGDIAACGTWIPLMVDTGAQMSVLSSNLAGRLGLLDKVDRTSAGVAGGIGGGSRVLGKLRNVGVRFGELELAVDFAVLDGSQLPSPNLAILGLDQLAVHHMVVDLNTRTLLIGGVDGYPVKMLEDNEVPEEMRLDAAQRCTLQ
ncbi:unnamed protein product [Polarella glacialis]|uniref:DNA damage-inducible protein 1 n=1 Tax=Polarella glacialis TaxID=89957 RepID=A0A813L5G1_POLGL|nr:unnamed protein product [Polarella glacialis]